MTRASFDIARSSSGRTEAFEAFNLGSSPSRASSRKKSPNGDFFVLIPDW